MKFGVLLPTRSLVMADSRRPATEQTWALLDHAEANGYEHAWVGDSVVAKPRHEPLVTLAYAAARTRRIGLGTAVLLPALRQPVVLANELATLDHLAGGRLIVGVGPGWGGPGYDAEAAAVGRENRTRGRRLDEHLKVWRDLWSGRPVTYEGSDFALAGHTIGPLPWTDRGPAVLVTAGNRGEYLERAFRRFARFGDGIITTDVEPSECAEIRRRGEAALVAEGRAAHAFPIAVYLSIRIDRDRATAEAEYVRYLAAYYGNQPPAPVRSVPLGPPDQVAELLAPYARAGATDLILRFAGDEPQEQLERFTTEVRPLLD
jgi:alkanesulfonate monooxygenase SsuD/methylene tetrahydromethanopterin reductase-like flavin-dependent oxidoreductase (luciferase family)